MDLLWHVRKFDILGPHAFPRGRRPVKQRVVEKNQPTLTPRRDLIQI